MRSAKKVRRWGGCVGWLCSTYLPEEGKISLPNLVVPQWAQHLMFWMALLQAPLNFCTRLCRIALERVEHLGQMHLAMGERWRLCRASRACFRLLLDVPICMKQLWRTKESESSRLNANRGSNSSWTHTFRREQLNLKTRQQPIQPLLWETAVFLRRTLLKISIGYQMRGCTLLQKDESWNLAS